MKVEGEKRDLRGKWLKQNCGCRTASVCRGSSKAFITNGGSGPPREGGSGPGPGCCSDAAGRGAC
eukprot:9226745-Pyramimonas_sp.AAC.1